MSERSQLMAMLAPFALGATLLVALPASVTFALALFDYDLLSTPTYAGLANFREMLDDPFFREALINSLQFMAFAVPLRLLGAVGFALLLRRRHRGSGVARTAVYLPSVVPDAAYALLWLFVLNPVYGPLNGLLGAIGLGQPDWLADGDYALAAIVLLSSFTIGEGFVIALAARQELPAELHDLARIEGSRALHTLRRLTLPLMAPTLLLLAARDTALSLQITFAPAYLLTDGGPDRATLFLPLHVYDKAFEQLRYGYGAAMTLTMFALTASIVAAQVAVFRRWRFGLGR